MYFNRYFVFKTVRNMFQRLQFIFDDSVYDADKISVDIAVMYQKQDVLKSSILTHSTGIYLLQIVRYIIVKSKVLTDFQNGAGFQFECIFFYILLSYNFRLGVPILKILLLFESQCFSRLVPVPFQFGQSRFWFYCYFIITTALAPPLLIRRAK